MEVCQQQRNVLYANGWFTNYQCIGSHKKWRFICNVLNMFKTNVCDSPKNTSGGFSVYYVWFYKPSGSTKTTQHMVYTPIIGSPTIDVMVYALFGGLP